MAEASRCCGVGFASNLPVQSSTVPHHTSRQPAGAQHRPMPSRVSASATPANPDTTSPPKLQQIPLPPPLSPKMHSHHACVSCRLDDKAVCHCSSPTAHDCFDFDLFPPTMTVPDQDSEGKSCDLAVKRTSTGWAFQGSAVPEIQYEEDIEADFEAIADDSGYFSNPPLVRSPPPSSHLHSKKQTKESRNLPSAGSLYADTAASVKLNHGSIYDLIDIASVKKRTRSHKHDDCEEDDSPSWPSLFSDAVTAPTPLDLWEQSHHRHEALAYRLEQPAKKRRMSRH